MISEKVSIGISENTLISGVISSPDSPQDSNKTGVIIAHGAGNDMDHSLILTLAQGLADAGFIALRFNFPYREKGKKTPDSQAVLVKTFLSVYDFLKNKSAQKPDKIILVGKSMGGRVASQMVADDLMDASSLIFLGFPLHSPGKKDKLRGAHLHKIQVPMLFFAGTRDTLCDVHLLKGVLAKLKAKWELVIIEGGDHSFKLPRSDSRTEQDVYSEVLHKSLEWLEPS